MILSRDLSIGIHIPGVSASGLENPETYVAFFRACESLGFDALWVEDRILHPAPLLDPMLLLTWAAAHTQRLLLGTAVLVLNLRQAPIVARQVSTLSHLAGDRVALGVSLGGRPDEYAALRLPMNRRVFRFRESLHVLRHLLSGEPVSHAGEVFFLQEATVRPAAHVPILMGGAVDRAVQRAGELADGWIMSPFGTLDDFSRGWRLVQDAAESAGRDPEKLVAGRLLYVYVDDDRARAEGILTEFLHAYFGPRFDVPRHAIYGPAADVTERLKAQVEAGITHLMLGVPTPRVEQLERIAREVAPVLRGVG